VIGVPGRLELEGGMLDVEVIAQAAPELVEGWPCFDAVGDHHW
jgi:hypothetical protein